MQIQWRISRRKLPPCSPRPAKQADRIISRKTHEVAIRDIRSINMNQSILERLFGQRAVQIGSAGTGGVEVEFRGVPNPADVRDAVRKAKDDTYG
jgi:uncharacterized membrane protein YdbT with pleckstrin-like domain